ncbi:MAG: putative amidohydrolase YtcJ [Patiriisocius sp.]|jgi:predicted amidohydrolase YtcJ
MKFLSCLCLVFLLTACLDEKLPADLLVKNATIYTVNETFDVAAAFVVKDGKILEVGKKPELELKYNSTTSYNAKGKTIVPGLIDAHAHLYNLGVTMQHLDLVGTTSFKEVLEKTVAFQEEKQLDFILGRGWDQNDWELQVFPNNEMLDVLFPETPVALTRIDGHAMVANTKALALAGITSATKVAGGTVVLKDGKLTGLLIDTPMSLVYETVPKPTTETIKKTLKEAEQVCLSYGLTTLDDAGLSIEVITAIQELQSAGELSLRVYAMISNTPAALDYFLPKGIIKTDRLNVRSVKVYADGALGSRGAALRDPYSDDHNHFGAMITDAPTLERLASRIAAAGFQMNTHAIGDSANTAVIRVYQKALEGKNDKRWRIEHAQVLSATDFTHFSKNIIPSIQPTHATSDMYWAQDRLGRQRIKGAYAYKTLLKNAGIVALGTDFPVEGVNPMHTFYAAVARKDLKQYPVAGFRKEEALSRTETLKGMTIWAAYANFEDAEKGSIEAGKFADFTVLEKDIMKINEDSIPSVKTLATFINGVKVFDYKRDKK